MTHHVHTTSYSVALSWRSAASTPQAANATPNCRYAVSSSSRRIPTDQRQRLGNGNLRMGEEAQSSSRSCHCYDAAEAEDELPQESCL